MMPVAGGIVGFPIVRQSNTVVLRTPDAWLTLTERGSRHLLVLPVHSTVQFYEDKGYICILDRRRKRHRFIVVHQEMATAPERVNP